MKKHFGNRPVVIGYFIGYHSWALQRVPVGRELGLVPKNGLL
jgi:hypothetical protein